MRRSGVVWGIAIMLIGMLFLLNNLGIVNFNVWTVIGPLALIAVGVWFLAGSGGRSLEMEHIAMPREGAASAAIKIEHGAGRLNLHAGAGNGHLLTGDCRGGVAATARREGDHLSVRLRPNERNFTIPFINGQGLHWDVALNPEMPLSLDLDTGAGESTLDMRDLLVSDVRLDTGLSKTTVFTPRRGHSQFRVDAGLASVDIRVPEGVAARIKVDQGLSSVKIDTARFPSYGDMYRSPDFDTAENRVDIEVDAGLGELNVR